MTDSNQIPPGGTRQLRSLPEEPQGMRPWQIVFQLLTPEAPEISVNITSPAVVGRSDDLSPMRPDLDLAEHGAEEAGISRQHAILLPSDNGVFLVDLDSTNGSWMNREFLEPGKKYPIKSGAQVELGNLKMVVQVVKREQSAGATQTMQVRSKPESLSDKLNHMRDIYNG